MAMNPQLLSYHDMTLDPSGKIMSDEAKTKLRKQYGYCLTCPNVPVLLFDVQKNRLNPLWSKTVPRTVEGMCANGRCLQCNPRSVNRYGSGTSRASSSSSLLDIGSNHSRDSQENKSTSQLSMDGAASRVSRDGSFTSLGSSRSSQHQQVGRSASAAVTPAPSAITVRSGHRTRPRRSGTRQQHLGAFIDKNRDVPGRSSSSDDVSVISASSYHTSMTSPSMLVPRPRASVPRESSTGSIGRRSSAMTRDEPNETYMDTGEGADIPWRSSNDVESPVRAPLPSFRSESAEARPIVSQSEHTHRSSQSGGSRGDLSRRLAAISSSSTSPAPRVPTSTNCPSSPNSTTLNPMSVSPNSSHSTGIAMSTSTHSANAIGNSPPRGSFHDNGRDNGRRESTATIESNLADDVSIMDGMAVDESGGDDNQDGTRAIDELKVLVQALSGDENLGILTEILISSMNLHKSCEPLQAYVLQAMSNAFDNSVTESEVLMAKILGALQDFPSSVSVQTAGCTVLHSLAKQASNGELLVRSGACRALAGALSRHIGDESLVAVSVTTLRMLSVQRDAQSWLEENGVAGAVAQAMQFHPSVARVQRDGCALLSNIAVKAEERTVVAVGDDVVEAVVGVLKAHESDPTVMASACFTLKNFSYNEANMKSLAKIPEAVDLLVRATSAGGLDDAFSVLEKLQVTLAEEESLRDQTMNDVTTIDSVVDIVELMKHNCRSPKSVLACMKALTALIKTKPSQHEVLQNDGEVLAYLLQCTELYATDLQIQQEARTLMDSLLSTGGDEEVDTSIHSSSPASNKEPLYVNAESQD